ncbi:hypothetical protein SAMN05216548_108182 [Faunimonas pinastri]|uniref:Uncharacterized protein n=1 Tax=Faunimonas pinastri TaxID=1855383 RepID=A0A1H9JM19_9HYPH|nr:hypothetical protein [Faunimonas pinastri]SEQ87964.1 hypothetical protein SAMN05216548_108182 [Faunimonas pinastri]
MIEISEAATTSTAPKASTVRKVALPSPKARTFTKRFIVCCTCALFVVAAGGTFFSYAEAPNLVRELGVITFAYLGAYVSVGHLDWRAYLDHTTELLTGRGRGRTPPVPFLA